MTRTRKSGDTSRAGTPVSKAGSYADLEGHHVGDPYVAFGRKSQSFSLAAASRALGPLVYAVRVDGLIKIGFTTNLARRKATIKATEILAVMPGTYDDEQQIHQQLRASLAHSREWYRPTPEVLSLVNEMRARLGMPALNE